MALVEKKVVVAFEQRGRVDRVVQQLTALSRSQIKGLFSQGCVSINGSTCGDGGEIASEGDTVRVSFDVHKRYHEGPRAWEDDAFSILFEDAHLIVVNKTAGVLTVPANPTDKNALVHAITKYMSHRGSRERAQVIHRLDRDVSGVLVFGKTREMAEELQSQFEARKPNANTPRLCMAR